MKKSEIQVEEQKAIDLEESGDETAAVEIWLRLAQTMPNAGFYCRAGGALQALGRYSEAESAFRSARELDPKMTLASIGLASTLINECKFIEALEVLDCVIAEDESALPYELRGIALTNLKRYQEALQSFHTVVELDPNYEEASYYIGWLLKSTDEPGAKSAFSRAIELDTNYGAAHRELGYLLNNAKQFEQAEWHLRRAIELDPSDAWALVYLGNVLWGKREYSSAEKAFRDAYSQSPKAWYPNWALATFYEDRGNKESAARFYHQALLASPDENVVLFHYGRFLLRQGDRDGAERYLRHACEVDPGYEEARRLLYEEERGRNIVEPT